MAAGAAATQAGLTCILKGKATHTEDVYVIKW